MHQPVDRKGRLLSRRNLQPPSLWVYYFKDTIQDAVNKWSYLKRLNLVEYATQIRINETQKDWNKWTREWTGFLELELWGECWDEKAKVFVYFYSAELGSEEKKFLIDRVICSYHSVKARRRIVINLCDTLGLRNYGRQLANYMDKVTAKPK